MAEYKNWKEKRAQETEAGRYPEDWIWFDKYPKYEDYYNKDIIKRFVESAVKYGIDPYTYVALGISESGLGNKDPWNPPRIMIDKHKELEKALPPGFIGGVENPETYRNSLIDFGAKYLSQQYKNFPENELKAIQAYSGLGKTIYGGHPDVVEYTTGSKRSFGKDYRKINYVKEKQQAKRVIGIREKLREEQEFIKIINNNLNWKELINSGTYFSPKDFEDKGPKLTVLDLLENISPL